MTLLELLKAARERLALPERWTQYAGARNSAGEEVGLMSDEATCFCLDTALYIPALGVRPMPNCGSELYRNATSLLAKILGTDVVTFNDGAATAYSDVIKALDTAIAEVDQAA